jgi:hypothetical protein
MEQASRSHHLGAHSRGQRTIGHVLGSPWTWVSSQVKRLTSALLWPASSRAQRAWHRACGSDLLLMRVTRSERYLICPTCALTLSLAVPYEVPRGMNETEEVSRFGMVLTKVFSDAFPTPRREVGRTGGQTHQ